MAKYYFRLLLLVGSVIALIALIGSLLPRGYDFETQVVVAASANEVFPLLNSPREWQRWSAQWNPESIDELTINYNGAKEGVGAAQSWKDRRGSGKLWITESKVDQKVCFEMEFANFPRMHSELVLTPEESGSQTRVTWKSRGRLPGGPFYGYFGSFFSTQMRYEYDKSLENLKQVVEGELEHSQPQMPEAG